MMTTKTSPHWVPRTISKVALSGALLWLAPAAPAAAQPAACPPTFAQEIASASVPASHVRLGQIFALSLGLTPSTGYHWIDTDPSAKRPFEVIGQTYRPNNPEQPGQPQMVGGSGEQLWLFRATGVGTGRIHLQYVTPGDKLAAGQAQIDYTVTVDPAGC
jgi:predicted secreted protein